MYDPANTKAVAAEKSISIVAGERVKISEINLKNNSLRNTARLTSFSIINYQLSIAIRRNTKIFPRSRCVPSKRMVVSSASISASVGPATDRT
jgi:hypothetical protein